MTRGGTRLMWRHCYDLVPFTELYWFIKVLGTTITLSIIDNQKNNLSNTLTTSSQSFLFASSLDFSRTFSSLYWKYTCEGDLGLSVASMLSLIFSPVVVGFVWHTDMLLLLECLQQRTLAKYWSTILRIHIGTGRSGEWWCRFTRQAVTATVTAVIHITFVINKAEKCRKYHHAKIRREWKNKLCACV